MPLDGAVSYAPFRGLFVTASPTVPMVDRAPHRSNYVPAPFDEPLDRHRAATIVQLAFRVWLLRLLRRDGVNTTAVPLVAMLAGGGFCCVARLRCHARRERAARRLQRGGLHLVYRPSGGFVRRSARELGMVDDDPSTSTLPAAPVVVPVVPVRAPRPVFEFEELNLGKILGLVALVRSNKIDGQLLRLILAHAPSIAPSIRSGLVPTAMELAEDLRAAAERPLF